MAGRPGRDDGFPADHVQLTRSFRFGAAIAAVANRWLGYADSDMRLTGAGSGISRVVPAPRADAVLCRGNADVIQEVLAFLEGGTRVAITGGGGALKKIAEAAQQLKAGQRTSHPELFLFPSWGAVQEYAENDSAAQDLKTLVNLVGTHGPETITAAVDRLSPEDEAEVTVSTAHKAKGREWASVRIGPGFGPPAVDDNGIPYKLSLEEARLIYVAVTRAKQTLDIAGLKRAGDYEKTAAPAAGGSAGVTNVPLIGLPLSGIRPRRCPGSSRAICRAPSASFGIILNESAACLAQSSRRTCGTRHGRRSDMPLSFFHPRLCWPAAD